MAPQWSTRVIKTALSAAAALSFAGSAQALEEPPYQLNIIVPMTGPASVVTRASVDALRAQEKLVNEQGGLNGRRIEYVISDDQSSPQVAVQLATRALSSHPPVIMGSLITAMCSAMSPLMRADTVQYCYSPAIHPKPGSNIFTAAVSTQALAEVMLKFFHEKNWNRIGVLLSTDTTGKEAEKSIRESLGNPALAGVQVVDWQYFNPGDVSVLSQAQHIKSAMPDAVIAWTTGGPLGTALNGLKEVGLDLPVGTTAGNLSYPLVHRFAEVLPRQIFMAAGLSPDRTLELDPSVEAARQVYYKALAAAELQPDDLTEAVWDPTLFVVDALRKLGATATGPQIRDALLHMKGVAGVSGSYDFERVPQRGIDMSNAVVYRWDAEQKAFRAVTKPGGALR